MNFANPKYFYLFILLAGFLVLSWRARRSALKTLAALIDFSLLAKIFPLAAWRKLDACKRILQLASFSFLLLAVTGPQMGTRLKEIKTRGTNVFILFDCSNSMLAEDFRPTRMEKAKHLLAGLLEKLHGSRVGIIAFSGEAFVYCPMTSDLATAKQFLKSITPGMLPSPGTNLSAALNLALTKLPDGQSANALVLLTDGEEQEPAALDAADQAKALGARIYAIGIGNPDGEPIPLRNEQGEISGYKKDEKGETVMSKLNEKLLAQLADQTHGAYWRASYSEQEIDAMAEQLGQLEKDAMTLKKSAYEDRYQWFLLAALLLWLVSENLNLNFRKTSDAL